MLVSPDGRWRVEIRDLQTGCTLLHRADAGAAWMQMLSRVSLDAVVRRLVDEGVDAKTLVEG